jgi:hypothetical protein
MKNVSILLAASLLLSACSDSKRLGPNEGQNPVPNQLTATQDLSIESLKLLINATNSNLALAEMLAKTLSADQQAAVVDYVKGLSIEEANKIINSILAQNLSTRDEYLFHGQRYQRHGSLMGLGVLLEAEEVKVYSISLAEQIKLSTFAYAKSSALKEIISAYDQRANELSKELAHDIALGIAANEPALAREISAAAVAGLDERAVSLIRTSAQVMGTVDEFFKKNQRSEDEQSALMMSGMLAGSVYLLVKDNQGFQNLVSRAARIHRDAVKLHAQAKELAACVKTLSTHFQETQKNAQQLIQGMNDTYKDLGFMFDKVRVGSRMSDGYKELLRNKLLLGKDLGGAADASLLSKQRTINQNFQKSVDAFGNLTNNLSSIISTAQTAADIFGVKLPADVNKALHKAQKVGQLINLTQTAMQGFATGGYLGALSVLGSGQVSSLLGGGVSPEAAMMGEINQKLDQVLSNQKEIMRMQVETMKMIKDMAIMIDEYHQQQMMALAGIRDDGLVNLEINKTLLNMDIRACERIINFQTNNGPMKVSFGINSLNQVQTHFKSRIKGLSDIRGLISATDEFAYQQCQRALADAFSGGVSLESPIQWIFETNETSNMLTWRRETYQPLLNALTHLAGTKNFDAIPLHLPAKDYRAVNLKRAYLEDAKFESQSNDIYDMSLLVSVKSLERYLVNLIVMLPFIDLDKDDFAGNYQEIVNNYLAKNEGRHNTRSKFFLLQALKLTQSAIAQDALLAGEPLLGLLHNSYLFKILGDLPCGTNEDCALINSARKNPLLLKNLLMYALRYKLVTGVEFQNYQSVLESKNKVALTEILGHRNFLRLIDDEMKITVGKIKVSLPSVEELKAGKMTYSENMSPLLNMQKVLLDSLEKVAPRQQRASQQDGLSRLLLLGNLQL